MKKITLPITAIGESLTGIAQKLGMITTLDLAAGVIGPLMNITGSILASYRHKRNPKEIGQV